MGLEISHVFWNLLPLNLSMGLEMPHVFWGQLTLNLVWGVEIHHGFLRLLRVVSLHIRRLL